MQSKYLLLLVLGVTMSTLWWMSNSSEESTPFSITLESKKYIYRTDQLFIHYFNQSEDQALEKIHDLFPDLVSWTKPSEIKLLKLYLGSPLTDQDFWDRLRAVNNLPGFMMTPYFDDGSGGFFSYSDELMVILQEGQSAGSLSDVLEANDMRIAKSLVRDERFALVKFPKAELRNIETYLNALKEHPAVFTLQPNYWRTVYKETADPLYEDQWYLNFNDDFEYDIPANCIGETGTVSSVPDKHVNAEDAWNIDAASNPDDEKISGKANGIPIKIAVLDDGVDLTHEDLLDNMEPGYDAVYNTLFDNDQYDGENFQGGSGDATNSHGTGCIGIAAAVGDNGIGVKGLAHGARIIPIRIGTKYTDGTMSTNDCYNTAGMPVTPDTDIAFILTDMATYLGFEEAFLRNADVCTNSWGYSTIVPESFAVEYCIISIVNQGRGGKGTPVLFAAGNTNRGTGVLYPARFEPVIAVGASSLDDHRKSAITFNAAGDDCFVCGLDVFDSNENDNINGGIPFDKEMWWGSNHGIGLDVVAPGVMMTTTSPGDNYTDSFNGTSSACPLAAGLMALILDANPNLTSTQARYILESTAAKVYEGTDYSYTNNPNQPNGTWNNQVGYGRVDALAAVKEANDATCLELSFDTPTGSVNDGSVSSIDPAVDYNYNINQSCTWQIQPANATSITLNFTQFDLAPGDLLEVYESLDETGNLTTYSAFNEPTTEIFVSPNLLIKFISDANPNGGLGWAFDYTSEDNIEGNNCSNPVLLECGQVISSTTISAGDNLNNYSCSSWNENGPERVYVITLESGASLDLDLEILSFADLDLFLLDVCDPENCIAFSNQDIGISVEAGTYFIVVDGYTGDEGEFSLTINCDDGSEENLLCTNAIDVECGASISGSTFSSFNQVTDYNCRNNLDGGEAIYRFQLTEPQPVEIEFTQAPSAMRMLLLDACDPNACIVESGDDLSFNQLSAGEYFLIIDAPSGDNGDFQFIISCGNGAPDLTYGNIHTINQQGNTVSGSASVYNASCNGTAGNSITNFYLSIDTRIGDSDDVFLLSVPTPGLAADETYEFDYTLSIEGVTPGSYYLFYRVDDTNIVSEAFGNTNTYIWRDLDERILIQDGSIPNITLVHGLSEASLDGADLSIDVKMTNTEPVSASDFTVGYYVSSDLSVETSDPQLGELSFDQLGGEATIDVDFSANVNDLLPDLAPGFYSPTIYFDNNFDVNESNGGDNRWIYASAYMQIAVNESNYCEQLLLLSDNSGTLSDGSGTNDYTSNTYCQWLIEPEEEAQSITINFDEFETDFADDYVRIFSGSSVLNTMAAELDGNIGATSVTINNRRALIQFSSDNFNNYPGWSATYTSVPRRFCNGLTTLNAESGQFNDGSDCLNYQNNSDCSWLIDPGVPNTQIALEFEEFALVNLEDFLYVHDGASADAPLVAILTGTDLPDDIILSSGQAFLQFATNDSGVDEGFTINYQTVSGAFDIAGAVYNEDGVPISLTSVACSNQDDQLVNAAGAYSFNVPGGVDYLVQPHRNFDWTEGVNVLDYILVQKHVVGNPPLNSPYKIIAADVNRSGGVTTADAVLIYQLILGNITEFPNNESWRFIAADHTFSDPSNPWADNFPEQLEFDNLMQDWSGQDFVGLKAGDVNNEADGNMFAPEAEDRSALILHGEQTPIRKGETRMLQLRINELLNPQALQARLNFDTRYIELINLTSDVLPAFDADKFGHYDRDAGTLNFLWLPTDVSQNNLTLDSESSLFNIEVRASTDFSDWNDALSFASAEDYNSFLVDQNNQKRYFEIEWSRQSENLALQANPNPFVAETQISYTLPVNVEARLRLLNLNGAVLQQVDLPSDKRQGSIILEKAYLPSAGMYLVELKAGDQSKIIQIVHIR